jgi:hypothetical protein
MRNFRLARHMWHSRVQSAFKSSRRLPRFGRLFLDPQSRSVRMRVRVPGNILASQRPQEKL